MRPFWRLGAPIDGNTLRFRRPGFVLKFPGANHHRMNQMKCELCDDCGWVCENHQDRPWQGAHACSCGGAGMACPRCNPSDQESPPRPPKGFRTEFDDKGYGQLPK